MNPRKLFTRMITKVAVLGVALCIPATMLAQRSPADTPPAPPPQATAGQQANPGQPPMWHRRPPSPEHQLRHLTRMLNLTANQQKQMLPILQDQHKRMESLRNDQNLDPQQRRAQFRDAMLETHQKLEALMTDSQKQQFEQAIQERRDRMRNRGMGTGGPMGTPPPPPGGQNAPAPAPQ